MATKRVKFTFPTQLIKEPVIYKLGKQYKVVTNIRRADVRENTGWVVLEIEGDDGEIDKALQWVKSLGVQVTPVSGDIIAG
jgi:ABC-type methionine transport system ATPase subunit